MMKFLEKIFNNKSVKHQEIEEDTENESEEIDKNVRVLYLKHDDCGVLIHSDGTIEMIFSNNNPTYVSEQEESLMALALFIKQPGFMNLLLENFRKIAHDSNIFFDDNNSTEK